MSLEFLAKYARPSIDESLLRALAGGAVMTGSGRFAIARPLMLKEARETSLWVSAGGFGDKLSVTGLAVPYDKIGSDVSGNTSGCVVCQRGAFAKSLASDDPRILFNLNPDYVLGRKSAGTAHFFESATGLEFEADPPDTAWANDLMVSMDRHDITAAAAVFAVQRARQENRDGALVRIIEQASLFAVFVTSWPEFDTASAQVNRKQGQLAAGSFYHSQHGRIQ
jgi:HK97 family phage prohead protease